MIHVDGDLVRRHLAVMAAEAGPLRIRSDWIAAAARRRRRRVVVAAGISTLAAVSLTAAVVLSVTARDAGLGTSGDGRIACGKPLAPPTVTSGEHGVALTILAVRRASPAGPPDVVVRLGVTEPVTLRQTPLQVLLIHGDVVVDRFGGSNPTSGDGEGAMGRVSDLARGTPYDQTVRGPGTCNADWAQAWNNPADYRLVAVMPVPRTVDALPTPQPQSEPLLTASAPLAER